MAIRAAEISDIIRQQLKDYTKSLEVRETGVQLVVETRGPEHADAVLEALTQAGYAASRVRG